MNKLTIAPVLVVFAALVACTPEVTPVYSPEPLAPVVPTMTSAPAPAQAPAAPAASKKTKPAVKKNTPAAPREETIRETQSVISTETIVS